MCVAFAFSRRRRPPLCWCMCFCRARVYGCCYAVLTGTALGGLSLYGYRELGLTLKRHPSGRGQCLARGYMAVNLGCAGRSPSSCLWLEPAPMWLQLFALAAILIIVALMLWLQPG